MHDSIHLLCHLSNNDTSTHSGKVRNVSLKTIVERVDETKNRSVGFGEKTGRGVYI